MTFLKNEKFPQGINQLSQKTDREGITQNTPGNTEKRSDLRPQAKDKGIQQRLQKTLGAAAALVPVVP